jgi:hypothetical protein
MATYETIPSMSNLTAHLIGESMPLVSEDAIVDSIQSKSTSQPRAKFYGDVPAEWIEDVEAIDLVLEIRDHYEAAVAALRQENARLIEQEEQMRAQLEAEHESMWPKNGQDCSSC